MALVLLVVWAGEGGLFDTSEVPGLVCAAPPNGDSCLLMCFPRTSDGWNSLPALPGALRTSGPAGSLRAGSISLTVKNVRAVRTLWTCKEFLACRS